jgi:hypothetical protein
MTFQPNLGFDRLGRGAARRFRVMGALYFVGLILFGSFSAIAQEAPLPAYRVKSAFLYNFAKFIQWPPRSFSSPTAPLVIGVIGRNPFGAYLNELEGKAVGGHKIEIETFNTAADALAGHCHVLFIGDRKRAAKIVEDLHNTDVLTVTDEADTDSFQSVGAVINLITTANRTVHFEINVDAARRAELKINSSLLNLAKIVRDGRA